MGNHACGSRRKHAVYLNHTMKDVQNLSRWRKAGKEPSRWSRWNLSTPDYKVSFHNLFPHHSQALPVIRLRFQEESRKAIKCKV